MNTRGFLIKLIDKNKKEELNIEKIKTVFLDGGRIGDLMTKTPMFRAIGESGKNIKVDILVHKGADLLVKNNPYINKVYIRSNTSKNKFRKIFDELAFYKCLRNKYDLYIDFSDKQNFIHILGLRILNPKYIIGSYRKEKYGLKENELNIINEYVRFIPGEHALENNLKAVEPLRITTENKRYEIFLGSLEGKYKNYFDKDRINIVFNFTASSEERGLTLENIKYFMQEIPKINKKIALHVMTMPNRHEEMKSVIDKNYTDVKVLPKTNSILEAAALVKDADMLFTVDTGIVHVAAAFNVPIVAIFPNEETALKMFAPKSDKVSIVKSKSRKEINNFDKQEAVEKLKIMINNLEGI